MQLFSLLYGKSHSKMERIMTDSKVNCQKYQDQRKKSKMPGIHKIEPAKPGEFVWKKQNKNGWQH